VATACGGSSGNGGTSSGPVTLVVNDFGTFGYKEAGLFTAFEAAHPGVTIVENVAEYNDHHNNLIKHLAAGSGAGDVEAVDEGFMAQFKATPEAFTNLADYGLASRKSDYGSYKWNMGLASDGKTLFGLGTDVGGLAMCYNTQLFQKAGLPTDPAAVAALWPTWSAYFQTGLKFKAANTGASWFDTGTNVYDAQIYQLKESYYKPGTDTIEVATNPGVKAAFDTTATAISEGLSGGLTSFSDDWTKAIKNGTFATLTCPAWMLANIQQADPGTGIWNVTSVPGGGGNWGGSWLTVPAQSQHKKLAAELVDFLTQPANQVKVFQAIGNVPSTIAGVNNPAVQNYTNPYFLNAPTGKIFGESALSLVPQYQGPKHGPIRAAIEAQIQNIEQKHTPAATAWAQAVSDSERAAQ
jgi:cellobiose transport system substrate-binding protein